MYEGRELESHATGHLDPGCRVEVTESCLVQHGIIRLRCDKGWFSMFSDKGEVQATPVDKAEVEHEVVDDHDHDGDAHVADFRSQR